MTAADPEDGMPIVILTDRQAAAFAAFQAGWRDALIGLPVLVDPWHSAHRWDWLAGWEHARRLHGPP